MAEYLYMENYGRNGKMGISYKVIEHLALEACQALISDIKLSTKTKVSPIKCSIYKGKAYVNIDCRIKEGSNAAETASRLQEEVSTAILNAVEISDAVVNINIDGIF